MWPFTWALISCAGLLAADEGEFTPDAHFTTTLAVPLYIRQHIGMVWDHTDPLGTWSQKGIELCVMRHHMFLFNHHQPNSSDCFEQFDKRIKLHPGKSAFILIIEIIMMEIEVAIHHLEMMFLLETGYFPSSFRGPSQKHHWVTVRVFRSLKLSITCCMFHPNVVMTT